MRTIISDGESYEKGVKYDFVRHTCIFSSDIYFEIQCIQEERRCVIMWRLMLVILIILGIIVHINWFLEYTKDYPQCRWASDTVTCMEVARQGK